MKNYYERISLSPLEMSVLEALRQIGFKSAFQLAENLSGKYDTLSVMRCLHSLLQLDLLVRVNIQGERYYNLNQRSLAKIKLLLNKAGIEDAMLAQTEA
jgi:hypothetical protein